MWQRATLGSAIGTRKNWLLALVVLLFAPQLSRAGIATGVVESVSSTGRSLTIRVLSTDKLLTFQLAPTGKVTLDSKPSSLSDIEPGQTVSVTTVGSSTSATRVTARSSSTSPSSPLPSPQPKPTAKKPDIPSASSQSGNSTRVVTTDWPQYRGARRDNISLETGLLQSWPDDGPELLWTQTGLGEGYSSVSVVGDTIFTLGTRGNNEMLFALERERGTPRWAVPLGRIFQDGTGNGPRGTPTVDGDRVYALGAHGDLVCAKVDDGSEVWKLNILESFQGNNIVWGISESVLIDDDRLICTPGGRSGTMVALNKMTGAPIWRSVVPGTPQAGYSSPIAIDVGNVRQYVNFVHTAVVGVRAIDGEPLWGQTASTNSTANCSTPLAVDNVVFSASGYGTGGALFQLASRGNTTGSEVVYTTRDMKNHHGGMVLLDGYLYGFDEQILTCLDLRTGRPVWQNRSVGKGSLTYADGRLYLRGEGGPVALAAASPKGYEEFGRFDPPRAGSRPAWAHPVVAGGRLYLRDQDQLLVFNIRP